MSHFDVIAFDADDTLWHTERLYAEAQTKFKNLLTHYHDPGWIEDRLYQAEMHNLQHFGYGIKAFALSMIETAIDLTEGRIAANEIKTIIDWAKDMLAADVELLEHVAETIAAMSRSYTLMLITKGDLLDQESKIARSGLAQHFQQIEIVSDKQRENYSALLHKYHIEPQRFLMVGNSLRSDILPVLALGANAVHVPYPITWVHEVAEPPIGQPGFYELEHLGLLPNLLAEIERSDAG
jgi:putative hydrolase of the HAD superfamily